MSDVDDELLALVGGGSSSSRASSPASGGGTSRRKRRRSPATSGRTGGQDATSRARNRRRGRHDDDDDDDDDEEDDAENSDDSGDEDTRANPFPIEGIYKDYDDRERLLDMPELEREDELARRRDLISQRRQKAELAAMVRSQQMAGQKTAKRSQPAAKKQRRLKKAASSSSRSAAKSRRRRDDDDDEDDGFLESDDDEDAAEEEDEESDFEVSRRKGSRANQRAQLDKLKKKRAKARGGRDADTSESSAESSGYSEGEMEELTRRKDARVRQMRGGRTVSKREDTKPTREEERVRTGGSKELPTLEQVNSARIRRDQFMRLVHRPEWTEHLTGKFARVVMNLAPHASARPQNGYRMVLIGSGHAGERYYELGDQYTNMLYTMYYGESKFPNMPLSSISNSSILQEEYDRWAARVESASDKVRRNVPSRELTLDRADELEAYLNQPFTEKDINEMIAAKRQARAAYDAYKSRREQARHSAQAPQPPYRAAPSISTSNGSNGTARQGPVDEHTLAEMNERHRRADRERIAEVERRSQHLRRQAVQQHGNSRPGSQPGSQPVTAPGSPHVKATNAPSANGNGTPMAKTLPVREHDAILATALDIDIDLGDF